ncbi:DGQHR domain-containing protein [Rhizobium leguminosarum]|uniref:DGQHR domain-containing protein n=1 Tax=Rhizobium leguminosarum TaxID=384 RepID=UPI0010313819|nr:DGQHR domain-containing protein [Rhizobium leguminosarum]TBF36992.1 DGQHR domain-containing protein [Rhizobium leguminosarum]
MPTYPFRVPALPVRQPLGMFFAVVLPVDVLLETTYSELVKATQTAPGTYILDGAQRLQKPSRLEDIAKFINRDDSNFPNSIILAANYRDDGWIEGDSPDEATERAQQPRRWDIVIETVKRPDGSEVEMYFLEIPTREQIAAVIDGQHRLYAFVKARKEHLQDELLCSVYIDIAKPTQAQIFATINSTQKPVSKSLTYDLFGYNVEDESEEYWAPEKLAVFLTRRLAVTPESPLEKRILVAPENTFASSATLLNSPWKVSFATIVSGIVRLISSNPKDDANLLKTPRRSRSEALGKRNDRSVLREEYIEGNDQVIYDVVRNFAEACDEIFWRDANPNSFIRKTVGVQALLDVLRDLVREGKPDGDLTLEYFKRRLSAARHVNFADQRFQNPSGSGRSLIRRLLQANMRLAYTGQLSPEDAASFVRV